ncbi:hypothetical protein CU098_007839 [Rhizopus stolonifer]|uniref:Uncharacterized protein n=1 Tax=Rhizopus stolonifer TaxID=4846 RepID=A0A367KW91_RHIST|nr:hypothetical protein CU098_007839 [Rhizopus stolonifer]
MHLLHKRKRACSSQVLLELVTLKQQMEDESNRRRDIVHQQQLEFNNYRQKLIKSNKNDIQQKKKKDITLMSFRYTRHQTSPSSSIQDDVASFFNRSSNVDPIFL